MATQLKIDGTAAELVPGRPTLPKLRKAAAGCKACPLWLTGTQTVFGDGPRSARVMMVGEQPGDREDEAGKPFVGPAGKVLDRALEEAGINRSDVYVTNAVKHFKWIQGRGKKRLHQKPNAGEIAACRPWLDSELDVVSPEALVCLGATAAKALLGSSFRVTKERGRVFESDHAPLTMGTVHPSSILRIDDEEERKAARRELAADLAGLATRLNGS
jgi:uracil-DNA glycosylase family protein